MLRRILKENAMQLKERLYLIGDRSKAVREADRRGRHLLGKKGGTITEEEAEFYGVVDGLLVDGASVAEQTMRPEYAPKPKKKKKKKAKVKQARLKELSEYSLMELGDLTVANLKQLAELNAIEIPAKAKKAELIDLLVAPKEGEEKEEGQTGQIIPPETRRTGLGLVINKLTGSNK